jgi:hypothetical protein
MEPLSVCNILARRVSHLIGAVRTNATTMTFNQCGLLPSCAQLYLVDFYTLHKRVYVTCSSETTTANAAKHYPYITTFAYLTSSQGCPDYYGGFPIFV